MNYLWSRSDGRRVRWHGSRQFAEHNEAANYFPFIAHEDLHFIRPGLPATDWIITFRVTADAAGAAVPGIGLVANQLTIVIPQCGPLYAGAGVVVVEPAIHLSDGKLEYCLRVYRVQAIELRGKLNG